MKPNTLKKHLETSPMEHKDKAVDFSSEGGVLEAIQMKILIKEVNISQKAKEESYLVGFLIAKAKITYHTKSFILPCAGELCRAALDEKAAIEIQIVPLSKDSIQRRIDDMTIDVERQPILKRQKADGYFLELDESVDITTKTQLLCYVRYMSDKNFEEEMHFCKARETHTRALYVLNTAND
ncbi:Zinc finger BED domain-containing protein 5-like [Oopsacas minuta]|uniref:Zinc finger BED domain-containing protein 5-like n=1 Tax=Oopsacas minuta TaxID=111878 RepID=A0AAV7JYD6_9METZ|nr:Zinc finger BED domain-containing protein 5-like [Oopsacas minuta]